jgi:hypothetical protein
MRGRACPDCHVNELAVGPQNTLFNFCIHDGWTICLAEQNIRVERRTYTGRGERIKPHRADEVVDMAPDINAEHSFFSIALHVHPEVVFKGCARGGSIGSIQRARSNSSTRCRALSV